MNERKYCRLRHKTTKDEAQVVADEVGGVYTIRYFYAKVGDELFIEIGSQLCLHEDVFEATWDDAIKAYQKRGWKVVELTESDTPVAKNATAQDGKEWSDEIQF